MITRTTWSILKSHYVFFDHSQTWTCEVISGQLEFVYIPVTAFLGQVHELAGAPVFFVPRILCTLVEHFPWCHVWVEGWSTVCRTGDTSVCCIWRGTDMSSPLSWHNFLVGHGVLPLSILVCYFLITGFAFSYITYYVMTLYSHVCSLFTSIFPQR